MTWKFPTQPFKQLFSDDEWAKQCKLYGFQQHERRFIDELIAFYRLNKPQKSAKRPVPPARKKMPCARYESRR